MRIPVWAVFILLLRMFGFPAIAQDVRVEDQVDGWLMKLQVAGPDPDSKLKAAWELGLIGPAANEALPALVKILLDPEEHPKARMSALHAVGHIGVTEKSAVDQILRVLRDHSGVFGGSGGEAVVNGSFESVSVQNGGIGEKGAFGETMFQPGSLDLVGWTTFAGITMIQDEGARPGGKHALELGPRDLPGCISQTILTTVGRSYQLKFFACTGRSFAHFNRQLRVRVAGADKTFDCVVGPDPEMIAVPFEAASALTTVTFCGVGNQGFGPMIDDITLAATNGSMPAPAPNESSRIQLLDAIAQRLRTGLSSPNSDNQSSRPAGAVATQTAPGGVDLMSDEGRLYVGHQLDFFERTEPGVVSARKPAWISLYRTEGCDFTLAGEVSLGGARQEMLFPGDLPDGFALFLREWDGLQRYQMDSRTVLVKRRLLHGQPASDILSIAEFPPPRRQEWMRFHVRVSSNLIEYSFAGNVARLPGPLDTDGSNKIAIAPGTRLRNLRLSAQSQPPSLEEADALQPVQ